MRSSKGGKEVKMNKALRRTLLLASLLLALIAAVFLIQYLFCHAASFDERRIGYYHNETADSIDVLFIGASEIYAGWAPGLAYEEYGFTSYPYAISAAPVTLWKYMLQDALRTQSPELVVVDPYGATLPEDASQCGLYNPAPTYQFLNTMPLSKAKVEMVNELCDGMSTMDKLSYILPFVKHHDNISDFWHNMKAGKEIRRGKTSAIKGMRTMTNVYANADGLPDTRNAGSEPISKAAEKYLYDFLDYCDEEDINVIFVHFPANIREGSWEYGFNLKSNYVGQLLSAKGYEYINLQDYSFEMGLDANGDFYQPSHLNARGQKKVTHYLGQKLSERIGKDNRKKLNESDEASWKEAVNTYADFYDYACENMDSGRIRYLDDGPATLNKIRR